jgi:hypothetical protein
MGTVEAILEDRVLQLVEAELVGNEMRLLALQMGTSALYRHLYRLQGWQSHNRLERGGHKEHHTGPVQVEATPSGRATYLPYALAGVPDTGLRQHRPQQMACSVAVERVGTGFEPVRHSSLGVGGPCRPL